MYTEQCNYIVYVRGKIVELNDKIKNTFKCLGLNIKNLREERNISIKELSKKTGIRKEYLEKIESGKAYRIGINRHLCKIANALEIKLYDLFAIGF